MIVEEQLFPRPELAAVYDSVTWTYVYRDFSGSEADQRAERIEMRFGVSSYPQIFLAHPETLEVPEHLERTVAEFVPVLAATKVEVSEDSAANQRLREAEARAVKFSQHPSAARAKELLDDGDIVVRYLALRFLAEQEPEFVGERANELLLVPHDRFRYDVCSALQKLAQVSAAPALEALVLNPVDSLNPNVLRMRAVSALATCGREESVPVIAPHATSGLYFNGLTRLAIDALLAIAKRDRGAREAVVTTLKQAYPDPSLTENERAATSYQRLARHVHATLQQLSIQPPFPAVYDEEGRASLMR